MQLVILSNSSAIYDTRELGIDQEEEAGVESLVFVNSRLLVYNDLSVIVHIGYSPGHSKVLTYCAIAYQKLAAILDIEDSSLIGIVLEENAICKISIDLLIVCKGYGTSTN